uniref:Uncharacterized protein n=1 Tax=Oryza brachyantha TaxID=4533 RepID=J3MDP3_ORYBR
MWDPTNSISFLDPEIATSGAGVAASGRHHFDPHLKLSPHNACMSNPSSKIHSRKTKLNE